MGHVERVVWALGSVKEAAPAAHAHGTACELHALLLRQFVHKPLLETIQFAGSLGKEIFHNRGVYEKAGHVSKEGCDLLRSQGEAQKRQEREFFEIAAVGYAMVINMMATKETWPFFALGFVLACIGELTLIGLGVIGVALALIYLTLKESGGSSSGGSSNTGDPLGDILNDY